MKPTFFILGLALGIGVIVAAVRFQDRTEQAGHIVIPPSTVSLGTATPSLIRLPSPSPTATATPKPTPVPTKKPVATPKPVSTPTPTASTSISLWDLSSDQLYTDALYAHHSLVHLYTAEGPPAR